MICLVRVSSLAQWQASETWVELDSLVNTCVVGKNALILHDYDRPVNVTGYDQSEGTIASNMRMVSAALAYDDPVVGSTRIIVINQAIEIPHLDVHCCVLCSCI